MILREIILGGLLLPFKLYFQPTCFFQNIYKLSPELPRRYSLWQARHKFRDQRFRHAILILLSQISFLLPWALILAYVYSISGFELTWIDVESAFPRNRGNIYFGFHLTIFASIIILVILIVISAIIYSVEEFIIIGVILSIVIGSTIGGIIGGAPKLGIVGLSFVFGLVSNFLLLIFNDVSRSIRFSILFGIIFGLIFGIMEGAARGITGGVVLGLTICVI